MAAANRIKWLDAPESSATVRVRMINTTSVMLLNSISFVDPVLPGREQMSMTDMSFLIEHQQNQKKMLFDLGIRKDFWNLPPFIRQKFDLIAKGIRVEKDVPEILQENGIQLDQIDDIVWSHSHWDHTGDPSLFPGSTTLNVGPSLSGLKPGYPEDPDSRQPSSNFKGRKTNEISFDTHLKIGGFRAHDFYRDGSFYLLETPGHSAGHMCGLARVGKDSQSGRSTFVLLGGDVCHFCGDLRPNETWSLPAEHDDLLIQHPQFPQQDPGHQLSDEEKNKRRTTPWFKLSRDKSSAYDSPGWEVAQKTVDTLIREIDSASNVFVALAHDMSLLQIVPVLNNQPERDMNDWFEQGWKKPDMWSWFGDLDSGSKDNRIVDGFYKDGVRYDTVKDLVASLP